MWFGFRSSFGIGLRPSVPEGFGIWDLGFGLLDCIPREVVFTMMSVSSKICFRDSGL